MPFIKTQKLKYDEEGNILSGSASLIESVYVSDSKYHSKPRVIEKLGKVLFFDKSTKTGIFQSPTRGLVEYCSVTNEFKEVPLDDERISPNYQAAPPLIHTVFGDAWFLMEFLKKSGLGEVLNSVFQKKSLCERLWAHILHSLAKDGSKISCEDWIAKSYLSYFMDEVNLHSLKSDTLYFTEMGKDNHRIAFFTNFVKVMRKRYPNFGRGCYVDSTPLPNDIVNNPFNALSSHGIGACGTMMRLVLVLDEETGLPVWYDIIPGNVLDVSTLVNVFNDVYASIKVTIDDLVLDAGYISKELINIAHLEKDQQGKLVPTPKTIIGRMPAKKGFPHKELYHKVKDLIYKAKYSFIRNHHDYFGVRKETVIFDKQMYAYVYVDQTNALHSFINFQLDHPEDYEKLLDREKDFKRVEYGYFILLSNIEATPAEMLDLYFSRTQIEGVFKTSKEYLDLLPLNKWTDTTVRGKILSDIIATIALLLIRKDLTPTGRSTPELFGKLSSLMCHREGDKVTVEKANKQVREYLQTFGMTPPTYIKLSDFATYIAPNRANV